MHRRETIMQAIVTALAGLTATVKRTRLHSINALPFINLTQGADVVIDELDHDGFMRELSIELEIAVKGGDTLETDLNEQSAQIFAALMADVTQGLSFVYDTNLQSETAPQASADQEQNVAQINATYLIKYEHSLTSAEA